MFNWLMNRIETILIGFVLAFFLCGTAQSAPVVTNSTGSFSKGGTATISGSGFGTKSTAAPQKWDNFESGTLGVNIPGQNAVVGGAWSGYTSSTTYPTYSNVQLRTNSTRSSRHAFDGSNYNVSLDVNAVNAEYYFSFWYYTTQPDAARQSKPWVIYGSSAAQEFYVGWGQIGVDSQLRSNCIDQSGSLSAVYDGALENHRNRWIRMEVYARQSSSAGANDGVYRIWISNGTNTTSLAIEKNPAITRTTSNYWRQVELGTYNGGGGGSWSAYMDDIYVDSTQARVEICDTATWAARTHCEIQIPTAWSDSTISFNVNQGSFLSLSNSYIYAVDRNGISNSNGYIVSGSGSILNTPPINSVR